MDPRLEALLWWGSGLSLLCLVATAVGVPWVVSRLPRDYFNKPRRSVWRSYGNVPRLVLILGVLKNIVGALLMLLGLIMLVTPGQGLLTLLVGLLLINFPGKYRFERWLVRHRGVLTALNWLRRRGGQPPLDPPVPEHHQPPSPRDY
ncbi:hypothetical protein Q6D67_03755 [Haliea sp. E1-2-M8]|uniref:hypothetical protein n=1 Tax=Haliea sp. E1-2-M8 TaxID=3064706 RepID=UPI002722F481|nr:hypothetical protein [Haliea sp. E1-2-M8]MDO8860808.1 hypothetical protein [Haliea sp. E1-2-M8]